MNDMEFQKRLRETRFVVDATHDEMFMLWEKFSDEAMYKNPDFNKYRFEQMNPGLSLQVGKLAGMPVCMSLFWWKINGVQIMVVEGTSQVVDHRMIEKWLEKNCAPRWDGGTRLAHCNAANFHHVLDYVRNEGKLPAETPESRDERERLEALAVLDRLATERHQQHSAALVQLTRDAKPEEEHPLAFLAGRRHS